MSAPFAQITKGPATTTGNNTNPQALILDSASNIVESVGDNGKAQAHQTAILVLNAQTAITTVTTAQNLINQTLNRGVLNKQNRTLQISGSLVYTSPGTSTPKLTLAVALGAVSLCSIQTASLSASASTNMPVQFFFTITVATTGASGTIEAHGCVNANISANTPAAASASYLDTNTAVSSAVDLTSALALKLTAAADSAISSITLRQACVEVIA